MECRNKIEQNPCECIDTGLTATLTGNYKYTLKWNNITFKGNVEAEEDANIVICCTLNENAHYLLKVFNPDNTLIDEFDLYTNYTIECQGS